MSPVGDAFTVGIVLLLLIGAVAFYLYTRMTQVEKRIGLLENILLDMRVAMENSFVDFPSPLLKAAGGGKAASQTTEEEEAELLSEYVPKLPTVTSLPAEEVEVDEQIDTSDYEKILESAHISADDAEMTEVEEVGDAVEATEVAEPETTHTIAVSAGAQAAPMKSEVHVNKLEPTYTSMAVKELRTLAQNRGITGVAKMSRKEIIEALHAKDSGVVDGVEASSAGANFESSLTGNAASIDA